MSSTQLASACRQIGRLFGAGTLTGLGEGQLLDRFVARRDDDAFEAIVARHGPMVLAVCRSLLRDPNDVDDAFQAVFLVLVKRADSLRHRDLLGPWLHGVARRVAIRARSDSMRRRDRQANGPEPQGPAGDDLDRLDERASVHAEVDRLPSSYRAAVVLCYFEGRTHEEAALELGWPVGTVRGRLARARDLLRGRLARRGDGLTSGALLATLARESEAAVPGVLLESTNKAAAFAASGPLASLVASSAIISARALALAQGVLPVMTASKLKLAATLIVAGLVVGPGAAAQQSGGDVGPRPPANATANPRTIADATPKITSVTTVVNKSAKARFQIAREAIRELQAKIHAGVTVRDTDLQTWRNRAAQARRELEGANDDDIEMARHFAALSEAKAKQAFESGKGSKIDYLQAQYDRAAADAIGSGTAPIKLGIESGGRPEGEGIAKAGPPTGPAGPPPAPTATTPSGGAAERLRIAEEAIATIRKALQSADRNAAPGLAGRLDMQLANWQQVADQARHDLGGPDPGYFGAVRALDKAREAEAEARKRADSGQGSKFDYLSAQLARVQAQEQVDRWIGSEQKKKPEGAAGDATALKLGPGPEPGRGAWARAADGEIGAIGGNELRPRKLPKINPADAERDKVIQETLEKTASIKFPEGTTLDEVLASLRESTRDSAVGLKKGVPFYVDPIVLIEDLPGQDSRKKVFKTIAPIELDDVPLRVALRLALDQFSLSYQIRDRMVYIIDEDLLDLRTEGASEFMTSGGFRRPAFGGMGGGMGGGSGGMGVGMGGMGGGMGGMGGGRLGPGAQTRPAQPGGHPE